MKMDATDITTEERVEFGAILETDPAAAKKIANKIQTTMDRFNQLTPQEQQIVETRGEMLAAQFGKSRFAGLELAIDELASNKAAQGWPGFLFMVFVVGLVGFVHFSLLGG
jgi:hypothetical protein